MVIPHAHYSHSTNFHDLQDIKNTSTPNTPQLAQTQAIKILWFSRPFSLLLCHERTDDISQSVFHPSASSPQLRGQK